MIDRAEKRSWWEEVSACCASRIEWSKTNNPYKVCSECKGGDYFFELKTKFIYHPSGYEESLEERIRILEKRIGELEKR